MRHYCIYKVDLKRLCMYNNKRRCAVREITCDMLSKLNSDELLIVDVRDGDAYSLGHITGAINIPAELKNVKGKLEGPIYKIASKVVKLFRTY